MFQTLSKKLKNRKGFTLIELIVVLAILGIILAIAVPNYLGVQDQASEGVDVNQLELVENAAKLWFSLDENGAADTLYLNIDGNTPALVDGAATSVDADISEYLEPQSAPASTHYAAADSIQLIITATTVSADYYDADTTAIIARP